MWILAKLLSFNISPSKISSSENVISSLIRIHLPFQLIDQEIQLFWIHKVSISLLSGRGGMTAFNTEVSGDPPFSTAYVTGFMPPT